jgi:hypothetical protein
MSSDNQNQNNPDEAQVHSVFVRLRDVHPEPSSFMKHRVLARISERTESKELWFWRVLAGGALSLCAILALRGTGTHPANDNIAYAEQSYVIQVALNDSRIQEAVAAGIELPEGVSFFSKTHPEVAELRTMELTFKPGKEGSTRLPFVVKAQTPGTKQIKMKFYNVNRELVYEKFVSVRFAEKKTS